MEFEQAGLLQKPFFGWMSDGCWGIVSQGSIWVPSFLIKKHADSDMIDHPLW